LAVMVEDMIDCDKHLAGDGDEGPVVSSTFHDSQVELIFDCGEPGLEADFSKKPQMLQRWDELC